ncbi:structural maintenance of chromosomes protein 5 [Anabrus simplex]|uniref:structural maintenance of chromosomes protein 5 n=1 Tax=Anabrus simplex TaxID=316456 RepID=UPI0035A300F1
MPLVPEHLSSQTVPVLMKGIVIKITLRNFVSYDYIEIVPGPKLNLILGPNGAGKSSIVSAIVLSLGGTPKDLGRDVNVKDFIKNGASSGKIKIELFNPDGDNYIISRTLSQSRTSAWKLNGVSVSQADIHALTKSLNIQVDNLCQILPQEKVLDFSRMNAQTLLINTEKAIGPAELRDYHEKLIRFTVRIKASENDLNATKGNLEKQERECEKLKSQVANLRERETQLKLIEELKVKRAWLRFYRKKEESEQFKVKLEDTKKNLEECRASEDRIVARRDTAERKATCIRNNMKSTNDAICKNSAYIDKISSEVSDAQNTIRKCEEAMKLKSAEEIKRKLELKTVEQHIIKLENDQLADEPDESVSYNIEKCDSEIRSLREPMNKLDADIAKYRSMLENIGHEMIAQEATREKAKNVKRHREETLARRFPDAYKAVLWLRKNKHLFSGIVFEPMLLEINIPNLEHAKYLEYIIPKRDLQAFICENKDDMRILISKLRDEMKLKINVLHSGSEHPPSHIFQPDTPIENLNRFGFIAYLKDLFTAPETILKYLCRRLHIHRIPLGTARTNDVYDEVPLNIRSFFSNDTKYDVSVSRYSNERCTTATQVTDTRLLNTTIDTEMLQQAEERMASLHRKREEITLQLSKLEEQKGIIEDQLNSVKDKRKRFYDIVNARNEFHVRLKMKRKQLAMITRDLSEIEKQMAQYKNRIRSTIQELGTIMNRFLEAVKKHVSLITNNEKFEFEMMDARKEVSQANNELENLRFKHKDTLTKVKVMEEEYSRTKSAAESALQRARELSPGHRPNYKNSSGLEAVEKQLNEAMAKATCLSQVNVEVIKLYEETVNEIDKLKQEVDLMSSNISSMREEVAGMKDRWLSLVTNLIHRINENFGKFLHAMGCAGEVLLSPSPDPDDYENYGIQIRVKYHENDDDLYFLDKYMQSGGEKTVATAIYLIAMQELTCVPFRCVDEINQGMDPFNERRVFDTLVNAVRSNNSQYFFLTPKLLPELNYSKDVTSIFIFCGVLSRTKGRNADESDEESDAFNLSKRINISQCLQFYQNDKR